MRELVDKDQIERADKGWSKRPIEDLEILRYELGPRSNFVRWEKKLKEYAYQHFGQLGHIVEYGTKWTPPEIETPDGDYFEDDTFGFKLRALMKRIDLREAIIQQLDSDKPKLFAIII